MLVVAVVVEVVVVVSTDIGFWVILMNLPVKQTKQKPKTQLNYIRKQIPSCKYAHKQK